MIQELFEKIGKELRKEDRDSLKASKQTDKTIALYNEVFQNASDDMKQKLFALDNEYIRMAESWQCDGYREGFCTGFRFAVKLFLDANGEALFLNEQET